MQITRGTLPRPQKVVIYGQPGIGKSKFASMFPAPLFIDIEQSTGHMDVARTPRPETWLELLGVIGDITAHPADTAEYQTLVIDSGDWAERLAIQHVCKKNNLPSLGGANDYGKSYAMLYDEFGRMLDSLEATGKHVVITLHSTMRKVSIPEEGGEYDRWEFRTEKKTAAIIREWADAVFFARHQTIVLLEEDTKKRKAHGGKRVMETTFHPCWDAKNRYGLPEQIPFNLSANGRHTAWDAIAKHVIAAPTVSAYDDMMARLQAARIAPSEVEAFISAKGLQPEGTCVNQYTADFIGATILPHFDRLVAGITAARTNNETNNGDKIND